MRKEWKGQKEREWEQQEWEWEQQELKALEERLPQLEAEKAALEARLSGGALSLEELQAASARYGTLQEELDAAEMRWLELNEI